MVSKSSHESFRRELFAPITKNAEGKYIAVLSDNSVDRDDEVVSKECLLKMGKDGGYLAALCNHDNDVFMQVAEWINRGNAEIDGHTVLIAEPKFYKSNPNSQILQGMLDEGAQFGVSIGAMVKDYDEIDGKRVYKDLELVEASFVAVPSNRHGRVLAVAKSYNQSNHKKKEGSEMELTQKDIDSAVEKAKTELTKTFKKQLEEKDSEIVKLKKELEDAQSEAEEAKEESEKEKEESRKKLEEAEKKAKETEKALEAEKKSSLEKMKYADGNDGGQSSEDVDKALNEGKLPVMRA